MVTSETIPPPSRCKSSILNTVEIQQQQQQRGRCERVSCSLARPRTHRSLSLPSNTQAPSSTHRTMVRPYAPYTPNTHTHTHTAPRLSTRQRIQTPTYAYLTTIRSISRSVDLSRTQPSPTGGRPHGRAAGRVPRGLGPVRQERRRCAQRATARVRDALPGPEPHRSRAQRHDRQIRLRYAFSTIDRR